MDTATFIVWHAESTKDVRTIFASANSFGISAKSIASTRKFTLQEKDHKKKKGEESKVEYNLNSNRFAPECEDEQRVGTRKSRKIHLNKDAGPWLRQHAEFIASSNKPRQDIIEIFQKRAQAMHPEAKETRLKLMPEIAALPVGSFGPRESELQRSEQLEFREKGKVYSKRGSESALMQPKRIRRSSSENTVESSRGAIARLLKCRTHAISLGV